MAKTPTPPSPTPTPYFLVSGNWENTQYVGQAPDTTGLTFTLYYPTSSLEPPEYPPSGTTSDGEYYIIHYALQDVTVEPQVWENTGEQTATFSIYTSAYGNFSAIYNATVVAGAMDKLIIEAELYEEI